MALLSGTRLTDRIDRLLPHEEAFRSALRGPDVASRVGLWLGLCFLVALLTGVSATLRSRHRQPSRSRAGPSRSTGSPRPCTSRPAQPPCRCCW